MEIGLRYAVNELPMNLRNLLLSKYNRRPDGLYYKDIRWDMNVMKPNLSKDLFYNGRQWRHKSNRLGIRGGDDLKQSDIVALGDSFIYGHGVQDEDTLCYSLGSMTGKSVANLGIQGDYPPSEYIRLKYLGLFMRPEIVLFFINGQQDLSDFVIYRPGPKYINSIIEENPPDYSKGVDHADYINKNSRYPIRLIDHLAYRSFTARLGIGMSRIMLGMLKNIASEPPDLKKDEAVDMIHDSMVRILKATNRLCKEENAHLIVVFQATEKGDEAKWNKFCKNRIGTHVNFDELCKGICSNLKIPFIDLGKDFSKATYFLQNDNHYSPEGNRLAASRIHKFLLSFKYINGS